MDSESKPKGQGYKQCGYKGNSSVVQVFEDWTPVRPEYATILLLGTSKQGLAFFGTSKS